MKPPALIALSPGDLQSGANGSGPQRRFLDRLSQAVQGGARALLLREPNLTDGDFVELARAVAARLPEDRWLGVHDRAHLVQVCEAQALHLGFRSLPPARVPADWIAERELGLSTHSGDQLDANSPVTYVFHGPVKRTPSKEGWLEPLGESGLRAFVTSSPQPVWALGGLHPSDVAAVRRAGCSGMGVLSGWLAADDPSAAIAAYLQAWAAE